MHFIGKDGQEVEFKIVGYQFATKFDNDWDANWLRIYLNVKSNVGHWQTVDSSLTTWEVKQLIQWFADLSQDKEVGSTDLTVIEPNLSSELLNKTKNTKTVQMKFDLESRPQSADDEKEYFIVFQFSNSDLAIIANDLTTEFEKFPIRDFQLILLHQIVDKERTFVIVSVTS